MLCPRQASGASAPGAAAARTGGGRKGVGFLLLLDVEMAAPVITVPAGTDSRDALLVDLGTLALSNALSWRGGEGAHDKKARCGLLLQPFALPVAVQGGDQHVRGISALWMRNVSKCPFGQKGPGTWLACMGFQLSSCRQQTAGMHACRGGTGSTASNHDDLVPSPQSQHDSPTSGGAAGGGRGHLCWLEHDSVD
jgi:hypothetical protein